MLPIFTIFACDMSFEEFEEGKDTESITYRPGRLQALFHLFLGFVFFSGALFLLGGVATVIFSYYIHGEILGTAEMPNLMVSLKSQPNALKFFAFISSTLPMIVGVLLACIFIKATPVHYLSLSKPRSAMWVIVSMVFVFVCVTLMGFMLDINKLVDFRQWPTFYKWLQTQESNNNALYEAMVGNRSILSFILSILFMALAPAIAEEMLFRGFLMNAFNGLFKNMHVAIVVTSVLFSLVHLQFMKFLPMFFLALAFGYAAYWSGSIWTSIAAHFINNSLAVIQLYFFTDGDYIKALEQGASMPMAVNIVLLGLAVVLFIYIQKNADTKTQNFYV
jgi:membrane protease YdiL (CAAX protease family)